MPFPAIKDLAGWATFMATGNLQAFPHEQVVQTYRQLHAARRTRETDFIAAYLRRITFAAALNVHPNHEIASDVCQEIFIALHDPSDRAYAQIADDFAGVIRRRVWAVYARTKRWDTRNKAAPEDFDPPDESRINDADTRAIVELVYATASPSAVVRVTMTTAEVARSEGVSERHAFRRRKSAEEQLRAIARAAQDGISRKWIETISESNEDVADIDDDYLTILDYILLVFGYDNPKPSQTDIERWSTALPSFADAIAMHAKILTDPFGVDRRFAPSRDCEKMLTMMWRTALRGAA